MRLVQITEEKIEIDDPFFGKRSLFGGNVYLVHDLIAPSITRRRWGRIVGDGKALPHLPRMTLKSNDKPVKVLFVFHGGIGDAVSVAMLFRLLEMEYNFRIDVVCRYDTWYWVLAPMGFRGERLNFPIEMEKVKKYDYIQTDVTNFISDKGPKWDKSVLEELAEGYHIDIAMFDGNYEIPHDVMGDMKLPESDMIRVGLHLESRGDVRCYPGGLEDDLISNLIKVGFEVFRFGVQTPKKAYDFPSDRYHDYSGGTNIFELAALIKQMGLMICVDSFTAHLSNVLGVKTITLLSTTGTNIFNRHKNVVCIHSLSDCAPCGKVSICPEGHIDCRAFYHPSVSPDVITARVVQECKNLFAAQISR